jgi:thymidine kinase
MAKLYFSYAAMNAGKSTILLQASYNYQERGMRTLLFTSRLYAKTENGWITSRIGVHAGAELYGEDDDLYARIAREHKRGAISCVFVDEAQFLTPDQVWQLARVADRLGVPVMCFGLRTDFQGKLFPGSAELLAIADSLREVRTICHCGSKATMVVRQSQDGGVLIEGDQIAIEKSAYVSLCRQHWEDAMGRVPAEPVKKGKKAKARAKKARALEAATGKPGKPKEVGKPRAGRAALKGEAGARISLRVAAAAARRPETKRR